MEDIPTEIYIHILSYLDVDTEVGNVSELETSKILEVFPRELYLKDWIQLFTLRFPKFIHNNLNKYDVKNIYLELVLLGSLLNYINKSREIEPPLKFRTAVRYLMINKFIDKRCEDNLRSSAIAKLDDIDLLYIYHLHNGEPTEFFIKYFDHYLTVFIYNNSAKILDFIFTGVSLNKIDTQILIPKAIKKSFLEGDITINTTKIIFSHVSLPFKKKISILLYYHSENMESYNYILNTLPINFDDECKEYLKESFDKYILNESYRCNTFIPVWNKCSNQLEIDDIVSIYIKTLFAVDSKNPTRSEIVFMVTEMAQHPIVRKKCRVKF